MERKITQSQREYILALQGIPKQNMSIEEASDYIHQLLETAPPTEKQRASISKLGKSFPKNISAGDADAYIFDLIEEGPPTSSQKSLIRKLGGAVPRSRREADEILADLKRIHPIIEEQKNIAASLNASLPDNISYAKAKRLISYIEDYGVSPPRHGQLYSIERLGADPSKFTSSWEAEAFIDDFRHRVNCILDQSFGFGLMSVKKPTKKIMGQALLYGDSKGWGENWEDNLPYSKISEAIAFVAPDLIKKPRVSSSRSTNATSNSSGCLSAIIFPCICVWAVIRFHLFA
jgi:hypothetical protein